MVRERELLKTITLMNGRVESFLTELLSPSPSVWSLPLEDWFIQQETDS
jgi:hypothetical protein